MKNNTTLIFQVASGTKVQIKHIKNNNKKIVQTETWNIL